MATNSDEIKKAEQEREAHLLEALQRKINELKSNALAAKPSENHTHGEDFQRGMAAGFVSGLAMAARLLAPEKEVCTKVLQQLEDYNTWAQDFNRRGTSKGTEG